jgi:signal transduction histidine kinase
LYGGFLLTTPAGSPERVEIIGRIVLLWAVAILFGNMGDRVKGAEEKIMAKNVQLEELIDELEKKNKELASLQEDLITAKRLEALNRVASMIIHDLKNAASQLSSLVQNMEKAYQDADFKEETISVISDTVEDMARMIGRLQNRPGRIELELVESDLNEVVKRAVRESGVRKNYGVTLVEDYNEMPLALIDERQMEKVLVNLIQNAAEAIGEKEAPGGGRLTLRSRWVSTVNGSGVVAVEVSDDGCGMSEDFIRNRLFKPFETTKPSGLGLGVYSCREIVRAHRGTIEAESRLGVGSTFVVRLPVANNHGQGTDSRG